MLWSESAGDGGFVVGKSDDIASTRADDVAVRGVEEGNHLLTMYEIRGPVVSVGIHRAVFVNQLVDLVLLPCGIEGNVRWIRGMEDGMIALVIGKRASGRMAERVAKIFDISEIEISEIAEIG